MNGREKSIEDIEVTGPIGGAMPRDARPDESDRQPERQRSHPGRRPAEADGRECHDIEDGSQRKA